MNRGHFGQNVLGALLSAGIVAVPVWTGARQQNQAAPASALASAQTMLPWAFPRAAPGQKREDDGQIKRLPGSAKAFSVPEINDAFAPPDWYPDEHPPMPEIVARGRKPDVRACAECHMPHGLGHPETSSLAGLPAVYIAQQMTEFKTGTRKNSAVMAVTAKAMTDAEVKAAADYFAGLPMQPWTRIVEANTVPKTYVGPGNMRFASKDGGTEAIGQRIIELPEDVERAKLRDSHSSFMAYVPAGSIKTGERLVTTGANKTIRCGLCHGPNLKGMGPVPGIAGRSPIYIVRQLYGFQHGLREGLWASLMKDAVAKLTTEDMVAIAAYTASREP